MTSEVGDRRFPHIELHATDEAVGEHNASNGHGDGNEEHEVAPFVSEQVPHAQRGKQSQRHRAFSSVIE
jgi:hypothetical protein